MSKPELSCAVVGAGISGLAYAAEASQFGEVAVFEASGRVGGEIRSEDVDGRICEHAAASVLLPAEGISTLIATTSASQRVVPADPAAKQRWIHDRDGLVALPSSPPSALSSRIVSPWAKIGILAEPFVRPLSEEREESVSDFVARRFGAEVAARIAQPIVSGIYAGNASRISVDAAFPLLRELEAKGGVIRGGLKRMRLSRKAGAPRASLHSFVGGMEDLPRAVASSLGDAVKLGRAVDAVEHDGAAWRIHTADGPVTAASVALCVASETAAKLVGPVDEELAALVRDIQRAPVAHVYMGVPAGTFPAGFGFLCHPRGGLSILGAVFDSALFPGRAPEGEDLVRVILGGSLRPELVDLADDALCAITVDDLGTAFGLEVTPTFTHVARNHRGVPQYETGHAARMRAVDMRLDALAGLDLCGWSYRGIGASSTVADAVRRVRNRLHAGAV